jgi:hypothetical protein
MIPSFLATDAGKKCVGKNLSSFACTPITAIARDLPDYDGPDVSLDDFLDESMY